MKTTLTFKGIQYYIEENEKQYNKRFLIKSVVILIVIFLILLSITCTAQYKVTSYANELFNQDSASIYYPVKYETTRFVFDFEYKEVMINDLLLEIDEIKRDNSLEYTVICIDSNTDEIYIIGVDGTKKEITVYYRRKLITYYF